MHSLNQHIWYKFSMLLWAEGNCDSHISQIFLWNEYSATLIREVTREGFLLLIKSHRDLSHVLKSVNAVSQII